jgi:hypothetical protein
MKTAVLERVWLAGLVAILTGACASTRPAPAPEQAAGTACKPDGLISMACGSAFGQLELVAHGRLSDGSVIALSRIHLLEQDPVDDRFVPRKVSVSRRGEFSYQVWVSYSLHKKCAQGVVVDTPILGTAKFVIRANGCEDFEITYHHGDGPRTIELDCSRRPSA